MADNVAITPGSGATVATDDVGGVQYQRVKPSFGADGFAVDVSSANPLPVIISTGVIYDSLENIRQGIDSLNRRLQLQRMNASGEFGVYFTTNSSLTTVSTVSTVSSITNIASIGSAGAFELVRGASRTAYNTGVRSRLTFT
mgnify:CR=1 FL=1